MDIPVDRFDLNLFQFIYFVQSLPAFKYQMNPAGSFSISTMYV